MQKIKDFIYYNRKEIVIIIIFLIIFFSYVLITNNEKEEYILENTIDIKENIGKKEETQEITNQKIIVDIKGEVNNPGTYELKENERVINAIEKAGGLKSNANTNDINLSEKVIDEMLIIIPSKEEKVEINNNITEKKTNTIEVKDNKISINKASLDELMTISGIGKTKAQNIIDYRKENGNFKSIDELTNVSGIGKSTLDKIKNYIKL